MHSLFEVARFHDTITDWWVEVTTEVVMVLAASETGDSTADGSVTIAASLLVRHMFGCTGSGADGS